MPCRCSKGAQSRYYRQVRNLGKRGADRLCGVGRGVWMTQDRPTGKSPQPPSPSFSQPGEEKKGLVCGKRRRFVLIRTGRVSSVERESVSSVRKRRRFGLWEKKEVCSYQNRTCLFGGTRKRFPSVQKRLGTGKRNQNLRRG